MLTGLMGVSWCSYLQQMLFFLVQLKEMAEHSTSEAEHKKRCAVSIYHESFKYHQGTELKDFKDLTGR